MDKAAIAATSYTLRTLVDGTVAMTVHVEPRDAVTAMTLFGQPGVGLAMAVMGEHVERCGTDSTAGVLPECITGKYGQQAKALKLSGFFMHREVWPHIGTDAEFLTWARQQECAHCKSTEQIEAAHVRRVANGAGTGIKPEYSAIPLCHRCHTLQHKRGESALGGRDWCDRQRNLAVSGWAWDTLKATLGYESWRDVPPGELCEWAMARECSELLPEEYGSLRA